MIIADVEPIAVTWPLHEPLPPTPSRPETAELDLYLVRIVTDDGICGWGEALIEREANFLSVTEIFGDLIVGGEPLNRGLLWDRMRRMADAEISQRRGPGHDLYAIFSAMDTALWDLAGKALGVSVARLMGGVRSGRLDTYVTGLYLEPLDALVEKATRIVAQGFRAIKMQMRGDVSEDVQAAAAIRKAVGNQVVLMADAGGAYEEYDSVLELGRQLTKHDIYWLEQPFPDGRWDDYGKLAATLEPPLAGGSTLYGVRRLYEPIKRQALHVLRPDPRLCGGITAAWFIGALGQLHQVRISVHGWISPVALLASANLSAAMPYAERLELDASHAGLSEAMLSEPPRFEQGFMVFEDRPGLGLEIRKDFIEQYARPVAET